MQEAEGRSESYRIRGVEKDKACIFQLAGVLEGFPDCVSDFAVIE